MEGAYLLHTVFMAPVAVVVGRIAVDEAIGQDKIDRGVVPVKRRAGGAIRLFKQQEPITTSGGPQRDFARFHRGDITAIKIADLASFSERLADVERQRFTIPFGALAQQRLRTGSVLFRQRQHQRWRTGAGIDFQRIAPVTEHAPLRRRIPAGFQRQHLIEFYRPRRLPALLVKTYPQRAGTLRHLILRRETACILFCEGGEVSGCPGGKGHPGQQ